MNKPDIVVLDTKPLLNGDLDISPLLSIGKVQMYDYTAPEEIIHRARGAQILITNKAKLREAHFKELPGLLYIGETATGVDNIDVAAACRLGITVTNVPGYSTDSVVQHVLALILNYTNGVAEHNQSVHSGGWQRQATFAYWLKPLTELAGQTLGLLGFGQVAQQLAKVAKAMGMRVIYHKPKMSNDDDAQWVSFDDLLAQSDFLSLHCPLTAQTKEIINQKSLKQMKTSSVLINTGRGGLVNENDLASALKHHTIAAACLDVLCDEPPAPNNPLIGLENCIITPHIAWASVAARKRLLNAVCENIIHFLNQRPINVIKV